MSKNNYAQLSLLWSVMFVVISVTYRPIEQLLSRAIAFRRAQGSQVHSLSTAVLLQAGSASLFLICALVLRRIVTRDLFDSDATLYWVLVVGVLAYAASYFARGWLAGHQYFALYGCLVFVEAFTRMAFALAVTVGIASGHDTIALGIAAAPAVSLLVLPVAFTRRTATFAPLAIGTSDKPSGRLEANPPSEVAGEQAADARSRMARDTRFAVAVSLIMLAEQTLLNAGVLTVDATTSNQDAVAIVFSVLLIARAPLQLFQAIQTSLLPHLAGLEATQGHAAFAKAIRVTVASIGAFAAIVTLALYVVGPVVMASLFHHQPSDFPRLGLAAVGVGMGMHLASGTLNQAALARGYVLHAAALWAGAATLFMAWAVSPLVPNELLRIEVGYSGAMAVLMIALLTLYRRSSLTPDMH
jgi:O-antigen/teichoic acid export membrane protein